MGVLLTGLAALAMVACVGMFLRIAWVDFHSLKIRNRDVLYLLGPALVLAATRDGAGILADLGAAGLLFALGLLAWLMRMMGAGDAKLYFPLGLAVGWAGLGAYALGLILGSLLLLAVTKAGALFPPGRFRDRLTLFRLRRTYPYGVPMSLAALVAMVSAGL